MVEDGEDSIQDILELMLSALYRHHFHKILLAEYRRMLMFLATGMVE